METNINDIPEDLKWMTMLEEKEDESHLKIMWDMITGKTMETFQNLINPVPHTTILQQTTLNIFCQKIENLYN